MTTKKFLIVFAFAGGLLALTNYHWLTWAVCIPLCLWATWAAWKRISEI